MLQQFLKKCTHLFLQYGLLTEEDEEVFQYSLEVFLFGLFNWGTILIFAYWQEEIFRTAVYIGVFLFLRRVCGGYHANTHVQCCVLTIGIYLLVLCLWKMTPAGSVPFLSVSMMILANLLIWYYAPVETANKPFLQEERKLFRRKAVQFLLLIDCLLLLLFMADYYELMYSVSSGLFQLAVTVMVGYLVNQRRVVT